MSRFFKLIVSVSVFFFLVGTDRSVAQASNYSKKVEFCEIANHPEKFEGRTITFVADYNWVFMVGDLLSDASCNEHVIIVSTADTPDSTKIRDKIYRELKDIDGGLTRVGRFRFVGLWKKNPSEKNERIKNLVLGYTMIIESAEVIK